MLTLTVRGEGERVDDVVARFVDVPGIEAADEPDAGLPWPLAGLPLADEHWIVGLERSPAAVEGVESPLEVLLVVDDRTGRIQGNELIALDDPEDVEQPAQALANVLAEPTDGEGRLPRRLTFVHRRLAAALAPGLGDRGV
jgi:hypothetical protein